MEQLELGIDEQAFEAAVERYERKVLPEIRRLLDVAQAEGVDVVVGVEFYHDDETHGTHTMSSVRESLATHRLQLAALLLDRQVELSELAHILSRLYLKPELSNLN